MPLSMRSIENLDESESRAFRSQKLYQQDNSGCDNFFFTFVKVYAGKKSNTAGQKSNHRFIVLSGVSIQNNLCILNSFYPLPPIKRITMPIV